MMNGSRTTHAFRLHPINRTLAALALLLLTLVAPAWAGPGRSDGTADLGDCQKLQVPVGSQLAFHVYARGVQIYNWNGTNWIFFGPAAVLTSDAEGNGIVGMHYSGPTWQSVSGGKVVGSLLEKCTPDADDIPWLLLAAESDGPGVFQGVNRIQRVNTVGGNAPSYSGSAPGEVARVPYTAEYFFYRAP